MLTELQLEERRKVIGASDVPIIMGMSKWCSQYQLWLEKTKREEPKDLSDNEAVHFGNVLEDVVAKEFERRNNKKVSVLENRCYMAGFPYITALLDRVVEDGAILEIKTTSEYNKAQWGDEDTDEVPIPYLIQVMTQMMVTGKNKAYLAVLIGGNKYKQYTINYSESLGSIILEKCIEFWNYVDKDIPPPPQNNEDLNTKYEAKEGTFIDSNEDIEIKYKALLARKKRLDDLKKEEDEIKFEIKTFMGENELIKDREGKILFSWKNSKSSTFDTQKFKKEQLELYNKYVKETITRRFVIK